MYIYIYIYIYDISSLRVTRLSAYLMPNSVRAVFDFQTFNWCTTSSFVRYKFLPPIHISYAEFGLFLHSWWRNILRNCTLVLSAKPTFQSLHGLGDIVACVHTVVFICFCKKFFQTAYHATPTCCHSDNMFSSQLSTHICSLHFLSVQGCKAVYQMVFDVA
jgi:hypothetical protein